MTRSQTIKHATVPVHIRWMLRRDMPAILAMEQDCFDHPLDEAGYIKMLKVRNCIGLVAERGEMIVGAMIYELNKVRLHLLNFMVHPECRYRGIGRQMIDKLKSKLRSGGRDKITAIVREYNVDAQMFFKAMGFKCIGTLKDHYEETPEDAYKMEYRK